MSEPGTSLRGSPALSFFRVRRIRGSHREHWSVFPAQAPPLLRILFSCAALLIGVSVVSVVAAPARRQIPVRYSAWLWRGPALVFAAPADWEVTENSGRGFTIRSRSGVLRLGLLRREGALTARTAAHLGYRTYDSVADMRIFGESTLTVRNGFQRYSIWGLGKHRGHPVRFGIVGYSPLGRRALPHVFLRVFWYESEGDLPRAVLEAAADSLRPASP